MAFSKYFELIQPFIDSFGVIVQKNGDGGDSLEREGMLITSEYLHLKAGKISKSEFQESKNRYQKVMKSLEVSFGNFRRHPDQSKWYGQSDRMSRDQLVSNIVGMGFAYPSMLLRTFLGHLFKRALLFTTNTKNNGVMPGEFGYYWKLPDFTSVSILGAYLRAFGPWLYVLYPVIWLVLCLTDLETVVNSYLICAKTKIDPTFADHLSHQMVLHQSAVRFPTLTSWWAQNVYKECSHCAIPEDRKSALTGAQSALNLYFDPSTGAEPMDDVYLDLNS